MLRHNTVTRCAQLGPHGKGGTYSSILYRRNKDNVVQEETPMASEHMEQGPVYEPRPMGKMQKINVKPRPLSIINGQVHKSIPEKVLDLSIVFDSVEPGNIKPRPYIAEIVEPISNDPEKHPIPTLWWWHKAMYNDESLSYATRPEEIETEGKDGNPFLKYKNPGSYINPVQRATKSKLLHQGGPPWMRMTAWWRKGQRHPNIFGKNRLVARSGANPWWVMNILDDRRTGGKNSSKRQQTPHWAFYKFLPILGHTGWGTKKGEIVVEDSYTRIGLDMIQWWIDTGLLNTNERITPNTLIEARLVDDYHWPGLKLVGNNCTWFGATIDIELENADPEAVKIVEANGGTVVTRWRDEESIAKEKTPWRFPVIGRGKLPPEELIRDVYANDDRRGYLSGFYKEKLLANPESPREWTMLEKTPEEIGEIPPEKQPVVSQPNLRSPNQVSLQKKQDYWEDYLRGIANTAEARIGKLTPDPFSIWEYTYFHKQGPGHMSKREPPEGEEVVVFPGYPYRDSRFYRFNSNLRSENEASKSTQDTSETPYDATQLDRVQVQKDTAWELKGEGWRTAEDAEIKYRNPYNNPYLKERIAAWQKLEKRKRAFAKIGKHVSSPKK